jgi:hypothetical protein
MTCRKYISAKAAAVSLHISFFGKSHPVILNENDASHIKGVNALLDIFILGLNSRKWFQKGVVWVTEMNPPLVVGLGIILSITSSSSLRTRFL